MTKKAVIIKERVKMPLQDPIERGQNFEEVALGYNEDQAVIEAERCLQCPKRNCVAGCPVEVPIPEFIDFIRKRDFRSAILKIKEKNVLPAICGRVCPQENQCEKFCTMGKIKGSESIAIGRLERFVADWEREHPEKLEKTDAFCEIDDSKIKIAVIGGGPAGLTCAGELAKLDYEVTVFEAFHKTGGVLVYGIPEFRLPKAIVRHEIEYLKECGVNIELNRVIGKVLDFQDLQEMGFQAIFVGVGAGLPMFLDIPGTELNGVLSANEFLTRVNLMKAYKPNYDTMVEHGKQVVVLGGGNVAMDSARTALRLGAEKVMVIYRRSEEELPARREEYEHAVEEGIEFHFLRNPTKIIGNKNGHAIGLALMEMTLGEPDQSGRRRPVGVENSEYLLNADTIIMALGTRANPLLTHQTKGLKINKWGYIEVNDNMQTSIPYVFAGGDIVTGSATVISAMGAGKIAAQGIHNYLKNQKQNE